MAIRRLATRRGLWLALSVLAGVGLVVAGLVTTGDLVAQVWGGAVFTLAVGLLQTGSGGSEDDDTADSPRPEREPRVVSRGTAKVPRDRMQGRWRARAILESWGTARYRGRFPSLRHACRRCGQYSRLRKLACVQGRR